MIEIHNLKKVFDKRVIFENINLDIDEGEIVGFVGPNGSGKSVLFKIICGFLRPTEGSVIYENKIIGKDIDFIPSLGVLIEKNGFIEDYNHFKNLQYLAQIKNIISNQDIRDTLNAVGLDPDDKTKVKKYSLGMRQKLGIAQAVMENPKVLVIDEPFNGLDKDTVKKIKKLIINMKDNGCTIFLTSHIPGDIDELADKIYEFNNNTLELIK
ncbi:ABC transporter ATP-binding protein [Sharpea azabuensis]|uniref:ABC transporter ATP-binding protein n=1 Tax=Sharpea azabuensis TaxID=322505 RepID=UPI0024094A16|nr:ATP-binding cassette domain-containing protein [Sharpea azabuensis]MDD6513798.1 ATP-binding cassette domain-containing protein [Sharpea azabuensis]